MFDVLIKCGIYHNHNVPEFSLTGAFVPLQLCAKKFYPLLDLKWSPNLEQVRALDFLVKILSRQYSLTKDFPPGFSTVSNSFDHGDLYQTQPGAYPCSVLLHACVENNADSIKQLVVDIVQRCDKLKVSSVAIPALRAGELTF